MRLLDALEAEIERIEAGTATWRTPTLAAVSILALGAFRGALAWRAMALETGWSPGAWAAAAGAEGAAVLLAGLVVGEGADGGLRWGSTWKRILASMGIALAIPGAASAAALAALALSPGVVEDSPSPIVLAFAAGPPAMRAALILSDVGWIGGALAAGALVRRAAGPRCSAAGAAMLAAPILPRLAILKAAGLI